MEGILENDQKEAQENAVTVEIKDKEVEDVNAFDSVSNSKSQIEKRENTKHALKDTTNIQHEDSNKKLIITNNNNQVQQINLNQGQLVQKVKKIKKGIFVSYSPDAGYLERKFVVETVRQLKENNLAEDIWFDKDENNTDSPCWFSYRMEAVEKCRAAVLFFSDSYFMCPVSVYEGKTLLERKKMDPSSVAIFPVLVSELEKTEIPKEYYNLTKNIVDLTGENLKLSLAEKASIVIGAVMLELEKYASINAAPKPITPPDNEFTGDYKKKKICQWSVNDLQDWLFRLGIKEFYQQSLAENMVDGFLLMSLTDHDMINHLNIDSRVVRKKIMQQILQTLDKEHRQTDNWHLRARAQRSKADAVYLVYDPTDVRLAQNVKSDLRKKNLQVLHHDPNKLGRSKEEFLQINGPQIALATHVIVVMTGAVLASPFVFHEVLFADWLGKKLVTAMFKNVWKEIRPSLKAVLGDCPAVDFETKMYGESLDVLQHHIKPLRRVPGVVLEQAYLNKMADGLKPLEHLVLDRNGVTPVLPSEGDPQVFISYQWDMQAKVEDMKQLLEENNILCWADISVTGPPRGHSSKSTRSSVATHLDTASETLQSQIQRNMKASSVVLSCITPKYLQSDNCKKDLNLAETFNKPIIPVLLRFSPLDSAPEQVRKILAKWNYIDLSNERLYKQNVNVVLDKVKKLVTQRGYR